MITELGERFDAALDAYEEHSGKRYPLCERFLRNYEEVLAEIEETIRTNIPVPEPEYDSDDDC